MRAARKDANHDEIASTLRAAGWVWIDTHWSHGKLLDGIAYNPHTGSAWFIEIKGKYGTLTPDEQRFFSMHPERSRIIKTPEQALTLR